jgi:serine protease DegQ
VIIAVLSVLLMETGAAPPDAAPRPADTTYQIPYRLTETKHVMVRVKINGKGPYNLILDTGAPAMFVTKKVAKEAGLAPKEKGWASIDQLVVEGGLTVDQARCRAEDLFQLDGMNSLGLAGAELHGVIGYDILARFRITYDFTKEKLAWVPLSFTPPPLVGVGGGGGQGGLEMIGPIVKLFGGIMGIRPNFMATPRGFLGATFVDSPKGLVVKDVWPEGPAAKVGFKTGDVIETFQSTAVTTAADLHKAAAKLKPGERVTVTVLRGADSRKMNVELGKGF